MNERIKLLAEQAGIAVWGDAVYMYHPTDTLDSAVLEKFALLIVKACAEFRNELGVALCTDPGALYRHFGVEE